MPRLRIALAPGNEVAAYLRMEKEKLQQNCQLRVLNLLLPAVAGRDRIVCKKQRKSHLKVTSKQREALTNPTSGAMRRSEPAAPMVFSVSRSLLFRREFLKRRAAGAQAQSKDDGERFH